MIKLPIIVDAQQGNSSYVERGTARGYEDTVRLELDAEVQYYTPEQALKLAAALTTKAKEILQ